MLKFAIILIAILVVFLFLFALALYASLPPAVVILLALLLLSPTVFLPAAECMPKGRARALMQRIAEMTMICWLYLLIVLLADALLLILFHFLRLPLSLPLVFALSLCFFAAVLAVGMLHARVVRVRRRSLRFPCDGINRGHIRIVVFSDLHLGFFTTKKLLERLKRKIAEEKPDCVLIAGDLFDSDFDEIRRKDEAIATLKALPCREGLYVCPGNHDAYSEGDARVQTFLSACGAIMLKDEMVSLEFFDLFGRKDAKSSRMQAEAVSKMTMRPLFVLDHQPTQVETLIDGGASLVICGHTHNGQTFPGNIFAFLTGKYNHGFKKYKNGYALTTAGCGYWGLPMRLFTSNEIFTLDIDFD